MQQIRRNIDQGVGDSVDGARSIVDWRRYVRTYPRVSWGTVAAFKFLIVPKRSRAIRPNLATRTELARTGQLVVKPVLVAMQELVDAILATAAGSVIRKTIAAWGKVSKECWGRLQRSPKRSLRAALLICMSRKMNSDED